MMSLPEGDAVFKITSAPGKTSREAGLSLREDHVGQVIHLRPFTQALSGHGVGTCQ